jgi:group I intron endonuclease
MNKFKLPKAVKVYTNLDTIITQQKIKDENRNKAAIYCLINTINGQMFIGSAITNRINTRFRNHCIHGTGSVLVKKAIDKYGLTNFKFLILEYYPHLVLKENLTKTHKALIDLETHYIFFYNPSYNILTKGYSSLGFKHSEETKLKMKKVYNEESKLRIGNLNKNRVYTDEERLKFKDFILKRYMTQPNLRDRLAKLASKPVVLMCEKTGKIHSKYESIRCIAKAFKCCHKTINKYIKNKHLFKNIGYISLDSPYKLGFKAKATK